MTKRHHNVEYLQQKLNEGYTTKDISKELKVSYKLIETILRFHNIPFTPWRVNG